MEKVTAPPGRRPRRPSATELALSAAGKDRAAALRDKPIFKKRFHAPPGPQAGWFVARRYLCRSLLKNKDALGQLRTLAEEELAKDASVVFEPIVHRDVAHDALPSYPEARRLQALFPNLQRHAQPVADLVLQLAYQIEILLGLKGRNQEGHTLIPHRFAQRTHGVLANRAWNQEGEPDWQLFHRDFPQRRVGVTVLACLFEDMERAQIRVAGAASRDDIELWPDTVDGEVPHEVVTLMPGDVLVMRGDVLHSGGPYHNFNLRLYLEWQDSRSAAPQDLHDVILPVAPPPHPPKTAKSGKGKGGRVAKRTRRHVRLPVML